MIRTALLAVVLPLLVSGESPPAAIVKVELLTTKHLAVMVTIDGKGPYRMIFDTGSPVVLINSKIAKECKLFDPKRKNPQSKTGNAWPGQAMLATVEVGGAKADAVPATVFDHPTVKSIEAMVGPIDGILGYPFFARFRTTVDYSAKTISFAPNGHQPQDVMQAMMASLFRGRGPKQSGVIAPAGQWGIAVEKKEPDQAAGVTVSKVFRDSPAEKSGLKVGDRLITIGGRWTDSVNDCFQSSVDFPAGTAVKVTALRDGKTLHFSIVPTAGS